ncbi:MAG: hypothetical protein IPK72_22155 [Candidatus Eisenbacteria bacterium]|nr:hypothetical protein [Candidatus Eisenbacteria bacterium]
MTDDTIPERLLKMLARIEERNQITVRPLEKRRFGAEVEIVRQIYNAAWERNWGFVPMTNAEIDHMAKELKPVVDPDLVAFAEKDGKPIGFALALPDLNQALRKANGKLWPFGLPRMMLEMRRIHRLRVLTLGVLNEYRRLGADVLPTATSTGAVRRRDIGPVSFPGFSRTTNRCGGRSNRSVRGSTRRIGSMNSPRVPSAASEKG